MILWLQGTYTIRYGIFARRSSLKNTVLVLLSLKLWPVAGRTTEFFLALIFGWFLHLIVTWVKMETANMYSHTSGELPALASILLMQLEKYDFCNADEIIYPCQVHCGNNTT